MSAPLGGLKCFACGAPKPPSKCSRCSSAYYCDKNCQRRHWATHKGACKVDAKAPPKETDEERDSLSFDDDCRHGGPPPPSCMGVVMDMAGLLPAMQAARTSDDQLRVLAAFVQRGPPDALAPRVCASMALDAFADNNGDVARTFLRMAAFFEGFLAHGNAFLRGLHDGGTSATAAFLNLVKRTSSRTGLLAELRARAQCGCLQPLKKD